MHDEAFNVGRVEDNAQVRDIAQMVREARLSMGLPAQHLSTGSADPPVFPYSRAGALA